MIAKFFQVIPGQIFWAHPDSGGEDRRWIKILTVQNFGEAVNAIPYRNKNNDICDQCFSNHTEVEVSEILNTTKQRWI